MDLYTLMRSVTKTVDVSCCLFFPPVLLNHTRHPRKDRKTPHLYYKRISCLNTNTFLSHYIRSRETKRSNKTYQYLLGQKNYQAFHAVSSVRAGSLSWSQSVRVSASAGIKEALPERRYSLVFCLSVKCFQRAGSLSKELKSMKGNENQGFVLNSLPQIQGSACVRACLRGLHVPGE